MGLIRYINMLAPALAMEEIYGARRRVAGKPTGKGNNTTPPTYIKNKKKKFGEKKLSKKQRKQNNLL